MVDPQTPGASAPAPEQKPEVPSFNRVVTDATDARRAELERVTGAPQAGTGKETTPPPAGTPGTETFDFDAEWNKLPERLRTEATQRLYDGYNNALSQQYGDVLPLFVEANKNANLRATLAAAANDPELRDLLADPTARDQIKRLTKKELREFLFGDAVTAYEKYALPETPGRAPEKDPRDARIEQLEAKFQSDVDQRESGGYVGNRQREVNALLGEFPQLKEDQKLLEHVVTNAETQFESAALRAGIDTSQKNPGWPAQALRAGIKPTSYREAWQYYAEVLGRSAPPAAPGTSPATAPQPPQAPRDASEGKQRALKLLQSTGGLKGLATASARRRG